MGRCDSVRDKCALRSPMQVNRVPTHAIDDSPAIRCTKKKFSLGPES